MKESVKEKELVKEKVAELIRRAETEGWNPKRYKSGKPSSLHEIINTPEKAKRFMKMLELVEKGEL
jgi:hypothetical protein